MKYRAFKPMSWWMPYRGRSTRARKIPGTSKIYYISNAGSDSNDGLSSGTSWQTVAKHNSSSFNPGDYVAFNRGDLWRETITPKDGVRYIAYGSGAKPSIRGSDVFAGAWTLDAGAIYYKGSVSVDPYVFVHDGVLGHRRTSKAACINSWDYFWDTATSRLYVCNTTGEPSTQATLLEYAVRDGILNNYGGVSCSFSDFDVRHSRNIVFGYFSGSFVGWIASFTRVDFIQHGGYIYQGNTAGILNFDATCVVTDWGIRRATIGDNYAVQVIGAGAQAANVGGTFNQTVVGIGVGDVMAILCDDNGWIQNVADVVINDDSHIMSNGVLIYQPWASATYTNISRVVTNNIGGVSVGLVGLEVHGATPKVRITDVTAINSCTRDVLDEEAFRFRNFTGACDVTADHVFINGTAFGANQHHGARITDATGVKLYDATILGCDDNVRLDQQSSPVRVPTATVKNVISSAARLAAGRVTASGVLTKDHNVWFGTVAGFIVDVSDIITDPVVTLPSGLLYSSSPAVDTGVVIPGITVGAAGTIDRGAFDDSPNVPAPIPGNVPHISRAAVSRAGSW